LEEGLGEGSEGDRRGLEDSVKVLDKVEDLSDKEEDLSDKVLVRVASFPVGTRVDLSNQDSVKEDSTKEEEQRLADTGARPLKARIIVARTTLKPPRTPSPLR